MRTDRQRDRQTRRRQQAHSATSLGDMIEMAEKLRGKIPTGKCNPVSEDNMVLNCDGAILVHVVQIKVNKQCKEHPSSTMLALLLTS